MVFLFWEYEYISQISDSLKTNVPCGYYIFGPAENYLGFKIKLSECKVGMVDLCIYD